MVWCPPYLKFLLTAEKRDSKNGSLERIMKILATQNTLDIQDSAVFEAEG